MKKLNIIFLLVCFITNHEYSQNLDSLFNAFSELKGQRSSQIEHPSEPDIHTGKCGLGLIMQIKENYHLFNSDQQSIMDLLLTRPSLHESFVTPHNYFRIHYDTSGVNKPDYDINEFAAALDITYQFEINDLGYIPPVDNGFGGDDLYDVYIVNLGFGYYGVTTPETHIGNNKWTSYIEIDNDFLQNQGFNSFGIEGARVTAAHEFHHAIQVGGYINKYNLDGFYYEITSTAMEEFVFDDVNDYYAYMDNYFNHPERSFSLNNGYNLAVWNIFMRERYNFNILKRVWELMVDYRAIDALNIAFSEVGSSLKNELNNFGIWTYYTNHRADLGDYFEEANNYPLIIPINTYQYIPPSEEVMIGSKPLSNNFLVFIDNSQGGADTLVSIISNGDVVSGLNTPTATFNFTYKLTNQSEEGAYKIIHDYFSKITSSNNSFLQEVNIFNDSLVTNPNLQRENIDFAYPQPFSYSKNLSLKIPTVLNPSNEADLYIFSSDMDLVYSKKLTINSITKIEVIWNGLDEDGKKLPSGVYIYVTKSGDNIKKGKIVIYND